MSATNPYRISDLIKKYGWTILPYISSLKPEQLAEAQILFVDSGAANALDADDTEHGHSITKPLATLDYAIGLCTANEGSIIFVAPGHYEDYDDSTTGFDADIAGITIIGLGQGSLRPRFDFNDSTSKCILGANDVKIKNLVFRPSVATVAIGLEVETDVTGCIVEDCEFAMGEEGDGTDEFVIAIKLTSGNHDTVIKNTKIFAHASCDGATHGISVAAAGNRLTFDNVIIDGPYSTGGIVEGATGVNQIVVRCSIDTSGTNFSFNGSTTYAKWSDNVDAGITEDEADPLTDVAAGTGKYPTGITNDSIIAKMLSKSDPADASSFENDTDSLEAIADAIALIDNTTNLNTAVSQTPTARSLMDILEKDGDGHFDDSTDSLEAIRDHLDGSTVLGGIYLDHLAKTADGSAAYPASVTANSILGMIMSTDGDVTNFDKSTDSLQSIADAVAAIDFSSAVSQTPTERSLQDILEKDNTGSFDDSTDSLEAIADRLIDANVMKLTAEADGGSNPYPDSVVQESVVAFLMSKSSNPVTTSFNNTTDSLEAIRDNLDDGTGILAGINLDHLCKTAVASGTDMTTEVADGSILSNVLDDGGDTSAYDRTKHSLFAIGSDTDTIITNIATAQADLDIITGASGVNLLTATQTQVDNIEADANKIDGATISTTPTAASLATFIASGGTSLGQQLPVSTSLVDIIGNFTGPYNGANYDDNIFSCLKKISTYICDGDGDFAAGAALPSNKSIYNILGAYTADGGADDEDTIMAHLDLIYGDTGYIEGYTKQGVQTVKATGVALTGGDVNVFTVANGPVKVTALFFIMAAATDANCKAGFTCTPTAGAETDLTPTDGSGVELNAAADAGDIVYSELDNTIMIVANTDGGAVPKVPSYYQIVPAGSINLALENSDPGTGSADIYIQYEPLVSGATITAT
jgi:hypothetical protein